LWTATELLAGGLTAGDITSLRLDLSGIAGYTLSNFSIRIKATASDSLQAGAPDLDGFSSVYFSNTFFPSTGIQSFPFLNAFNWDGVANLIVEFSFTNATSLSLASTVQGDVATAGKSLQSNANDSYLWLNHNGQFIDVPRHCFFHQLTMRLPLPFGCMVILPHCRPIPPSLRVLIRTIRDN
jgi:hypothetical protein